MEYSQELAVFGKTALDRTVWMMTSIFLRNAPLCKYDKKRIIDYALGKSPPEEIREVREHVRNCWACLNLVIETLIEERLGEVKLSGMKKHARRDKKNAAG